MGWNIFWFSHKETDSGRREPELFDLRQWDRYLKSIKHTQIGTDKYILYNHQKATEDADSARLPPNNHHIDSLNIEVYVKAVN